MWNRVIETGGLTVNEEVVITCEIELINTGKKELKMEYERPEAEERIL